MDEEVKNIIQHHKIAFDSLKKIQTGLFNTTFRVKRSDNKKDLIIRIAPDENTGMLFYEKNMMVREPEIHEKVIAQTSLPAPNIIAYDFSKKVICKNYLIMEYMDGIPMSEITLEPNDQQQIFRQLGAYLRELHESVRHKTYGYTGNTCMQLQRSWFGAFRIMWHKLIDDISSCKVYTEQENKFAKNQLDKFSKAFSRNVPASLLHMDIWSQNILVDRNKQISGILDWDRALFGDPEIEFGVLAYVGFLNEDFKKGYEAIPYETNNFNIRQVFYYLYEFQKYLVIWTLRRPNQTMVKNYKEYALQNLRNLK